MKIATRAALALAVLLVAGTGCAAEEQAPRLVWPGDGSGGGAALPDTHANQPYSFGGLVVCLDQPGRVTIEKVTVNKPQGGLRVAAFATRPNPMETGAMGFGSEPKKLAEVGFDTSSSSVATRCSSQNTVSHRPNEEYRSTELAVEFVKPSEATAQGHSLTVAYRSGEDLRTLDIPFKVVLCGPGGKSDHEHCT